MQLQISYQSIESSDPGINVPGPRRTVSKLRNETYHMFSNLHPGTTYLISVRARTAKGFGQTALTEITTNISGEDCIWLFWGLVHVGVCTCKYVCKTGHFHFISDPSVGPKVSVFKCFLTIFLLR